ncbi:delta(1)-pyrroline-2-carboxylate reductase family protein [Rubrobacter taiwanensis]|uniref:Delta(1)-pyrroline-2-carboxylate reductase family protein n=1 Tax=Rubrobacter taiwanensis TaxID=185139 RepID=A0A4R1BRM8_9ACTN|nr:delta(1)-pyrroline-2-carboxylate reductase family protein [Rubrobacter taiwanensis]TCJ19997.1 delta(1)-pyrroline-2-carboxylate reductase family protein [Rubrobacter taiwanensis]
MRILGAEETRERLPYARLADSIREVALARGRGAVRAPERLAVPLPEGGTLLVMPAADAELAMTKLVTVHPENAGRGLPAIRGEVVVMEAATGRRLALLDGSAVTARRTAALSLLAARELARHPEGPLLVVGAGTQGRSHLEAFREGLGVGEAFVASRTRESAERLAEHARGLGMRARAVDGPEEVLGDVPLVVTATTSAEPVLPEGVTQEAFIAAVGAFRPEMAELPPGLVARAVVVVDTLEGARAEAGDLIRAADVGAFDWEDAVELEEVLQGRGFGAGPVVFKSVGHALWDLAAVRAALAEA